MIPSVYQQLIFEMLWRVEVFTRWFFTITTTLNTVVTRGDASILYFNVGRRMGKLALGVRAGALVPLVLAAYLQLQPAGILSVQ